MVEVKPADYDEIIEAMDWFSQREGVPYSVIFYNSYGRMEWGEDGTGVLACGCPATITAYRRVREELREEVAERLVGGPVADADENRLALGLGWSQHFFNGFVTAVDEEPAKFEERRQYRQQYGGEYAAGLELGHRVRLALEGSVTGDHAWDVWDADVFDSK